MASPTNTAVATLGAWLNRLQLDVQQVLPMLEAYTQTADAALAPGPGNAPGVPAGGSTSAIVPSPGQPAANFGAQYGSSSAGQAGVNAGVNAGVPAAGGGNLALNQTPGPVGSGYRNTGPGSVNGNAPVGNLALNQTPGPVGSANRSTAATTTTTPAAGDQALSRTGVNNPYGLQEIGTSATVGVSGDTPVVPELAILKSDLQRILPVLVAINNGGLLRAANSTGASVETGTGVSVGSGSSAVNTIAGQNPGVGATVPDTQGNVRTGEQNMAPPGNRTTGGSGTDPQ